jgi:hypothetical protein
MGYDEFNMDISSQKLTFPPPDVPLGIEWVSVLREYMMPDRRFTEDLKGTQPMTILLRRAAAGALQVSGTRLFGRALRRLAPDLRTDESRFRRRQARLR